MTLGERLKHISEIVGGVKILADHLQMKSPGLYSYFHDRTKPGAGLLLRFFSLGFSIDWIITGKGSMYNNTDAGRRRRNSVVLNSIILATFGERLKMFAESKFGKINELAKAAGIEKSKINGLIRENTPPDVKSLQRLAQLGCNINWLLTGEGEMTFQQNSDLAFLDIDPEEGKEYIMKIKILQGKLTVETISNV